MGWVFWVFGQISSSFQDNWGTIWDFGYTLTTTFGTVLTKSGVKLKRFSTKVRFKLFGNWLKVE